MSTGEVVLGVALLILIGVLGVLILRGRSGGRIHTSVQAGALKFSFELSQQARLDVGAQLEAAVAKTGLGRGEDAARGRLATTETIKAGRVLWVDDNPDSIVEESLMLAGLGLAITQTTSTETALRYVGQGSYEMLITDLGRGGNPQAGLDLLERLPPSSGEMTSLVYTMNAGERADRAIELGATAVVETPSDLLEAVLARFAR
jgi:CheY-like chemotaxis protein